MKDRALYKLLTDLNGSITKTEAGKPKFHDPRYEPEPLSESNFYPISGKVPKDRKVSFVDGGNRELFSSPFFSIHLVRVYFNIFRGKERLNPGYLPQRIDFYALAKAYIENGEVHYSGKLYSVKDEHKQYLPDDRDLKFNSWDRSIMTGRFRGNINKVCTSARRFAEWKIGGIVAKEELEEGDLLVKDGTLQTSVTNEAKYSNSAYEMATQNGVVFSGLAKTTSLYTTTGNSLVKILKDMGDEVLPENSWYYYPVAENNHPDHKGEIYFVKLFNRSDYAFRYEIFRDWIRRAKREEVESILATLAKNSKDIRFPGYPFGLVDADDIARVTEAGKEIHRSKLKAHATRNGWDEIEKYLAATDAHDKLNKLRAR